MSKMTKNERMVWAAAFAIALTDERRSDKGASDAAFGAVSTLRHVAAYFREHEEGTDAELCCRQMVEE
jgi:hypothetical protein